MDKELGRINPAVFEFRTYPSSSCTDLTLDNISQSTTQVSNGLLGGAIQIITKSSKMDSALKPQSLEGWLK